MTARKIVEAIVLAVVTIVVAKILRSDRFVLRAVTILAIFAIGTALEILPGKSTRRS